MFSFPISPSAKLILVTAHRRENFGEPLKNICLALRDLALHYGEKVQIVYPVHLNPNVQERATQILMDIPNVELTDPLDYLQLAQLMNRAYMVLTDSGGIQEEAPSLGVPVLVLRNKTERPEAIEAGTVKLVGTDKDKIICEVENLLNNVDAYNKMAHAVNPYGDGHASERIVSALLGEPFQPWQP